MNPAVVEVDATISTFADAPGIEVAARIPHVANSVMSRIFPEKPFIVVLVIARCVAGDGNIYSGTEVAANEIAGVLADCYGRNGR